MPSQMEKPSLSEITIIGIYITKRVFQLHEARDDGSVVFRKKLSRDQVLVFLTQQPNCVVAMEACATAHGWGRELEKLGHSVRLIPQVYVKQFVKRQNNNAADANAIVEATLRPTVRFASVKTEDLQARAMLFHARQMTMTRNWGYNVEPFRDILSDAIQAAAAGAGQAVRLDDLRDARQVFGQHAA
jgi:transposase